MGDRFVEDRSLSVLRALALPSENDLGMDQICALASDMFDVPIALVTLLDEEYQWLIARYGFDVERLPRNTAFCNFTILGEGVFVVPNAPEDERFAGNALVTGAPHIRFYAGAPLEWEPGIRLGALCVIDTEARSLSLVKQRRLAQLARLVVAHIRNRAATRDLQQDVAQAAITHSALEWTSSHDALTGLPNRAPFRAALQRAIEETKPGQRGALLLLDLDEFKRINDTMGHEAGDALLVAVSGRLAELVRAPNLVARLGGDEFGILLSTALSEDELEAFGARINVALSEPFEHEQYRLHCTASIGLATFPDHATSASELLRYADLALYAAKDEGRGRSSMYRPALGVQLQARIAALERARSALERNAIVPYYQPKISLGSGEIVGFEALLRWSDPILGIQSPLTIWEAFKDPALSVNIGQRMRDLVMSDMAIWRQHNVPFGAVAINVSAGEFSRGDLALTIRESMAAFRLPADTLELEVTETVLLDDRSDKITKTLQALGHDGVAIALDDFGTGYASLSHLQKLPVQSIKIDKSFVGDMTENRESAAIVNLCIELAQSFGIGVVAEGVETEAQAQMLKNWHCDVAQGYLFGKPVEAELVPSLLAGWSAEDAKSFVARQRS